MEDPATHPGVPRGGARAPHPFQPADCAASPLAGAPDWAARHLIPEAPPPHLTNGASFDALHPPAVRGEGPCPRACVTYYDRRNLRRAPQGDNRFELDADNPGSGPSPADLRHCLMASPARGRPALAPAPVTYQPALYDSEGRVVPYDPATWRIDGVRGCVEFPWGLPPRLAASAAKPVPFRLSFFTYTGPLRADPPVAPRNPDPEENAVFVASAAAPRPTGELASPYGSLEQAFAAVRARKWAAPARIVLLGRGPHRLSRAESGHSLVEVRGPATTVAEGVVQAASRGGGGNLLTLEVSHLSPCAGAGPEASPPGPGDFAWFPRTRTSAFIGEASRAGEGLSLLLAHPPGAEPDCAAGDAVLVQRPGAVVELEGPVELGPGPTAWENVDFVSPARSAGSLRLAAKTGFVQCRISVGSDAGLLVEGGPVVAGHPAHGWEEAVASPARAGLYVSATGGPFVRRAATWAPDRAAGCVFDGAARLYGASEIGASYFRGAGAQLVFSGGASELANVLFRCDPGPGRALLQADSGAFLRIRSAEVDLPPPAGAGSVALFAAQAIVEATGLCVRGAETALEARAATVRVREGLLTGGLGDGVAASGGSTLDLTATTVEGGQGRGIGATDSTLLLTDSAVRGNGSDGIDAVNCRVALTCAGGGPPGAGHIVGNRGAGVRVRAGSTGRLDGLHIADNADSGLVVDGASSLLWSRCVATGNAGGVRVAGCSSLDAAPPYTIAGNNAPGAEGGVGVSVRGASSCHLGPGRVDGHRLTQAEATPQSRVENEGGRP